MTPAGFAHSEIHGSRAMCASPWLIAACHVLRRLPVPRHPPCALTIFSSMVRYIHTLSNSMLLAIRCDLLEKENIVFKSRYAALKVRRGRPPGTGHCAPRGAATDSLERFQLNRRARPVGQGKSMSSLEEVILPRQEVIQPHVPVRLPCYDFTPLAPRTFGASAPLRVRPATSGADDSGGVTGGVYKARERIHRGVLIRDY